MAIEIAGRRGLPFPRCLFLHDNYIPRLSGANNVPLPAKYNPSRLCLYSPPLRSCYSTEHRGVRTSGPRKTGKRRRLGSAELGKPMTARLSATATETVGAKAALSLPDSPSFSFIDTAEELGEIIDSLAQLPSNPPSLYLDLEGVNLSRAGTISILQILVSPLNHTYIIDIHTLKNKAFLTPSANGQTLKAILESKSIPKVFFDIRADSDALYSNYGVSLGGIQDIQVMEFATRNFTTPYVNGMARCIEREAGLSTSQKIQWAAVKAQGKTLFDPKRGGSYEVFNHRPLSPEMMAYCTQDVQYMPNLWRFYSSKLGRELVESVEVETKRRVALSQVPTFNPKGPHMAKGPMEVRPVLSGKFSIRPVYDMEEHDILPGDGSVLLYTANNGLEGLWSTFLATLSRNRFVSTFRRLLG